jgi:hypothetical protein
MRTGPAHVTFAVALLPGAAAPGGASAATNLLSSLTSADLARVQSKDASVARPLASKALTVTFGYTQGEAEVRLPLALLKLPTDWSRFKTVSYTFFTTSVEPISIGFSDGARTRFVLTEPLAGIRIRGVIPFDAFVQTRAMIPLRPLGYKAWFERLFTFERVEEVIFKMKRPSQPTHLTLYVLRRECDAAVRRRLEGGVDAPHPCGACAAGASTRSATGETTRSRPGAGCPTCGSSTGGRRGRRSPSCGSPKLRRAGYGTAYP